MYKGSAVPMEESEIVSGKDEALDQVSEMLTTPPTEEEVSHTLTRLRRTPSSKEYAVLAIEPPIRRRLSKSAFEMFTATDEPLT